MKLYIKQKVFSWRDKFRIFNEYGEEAFHAEGEVFTLGKKLHLYSNEGYELSYIHQKVFSFLPRYFISVGGNDVAEVVKRFTFIKQKYEISGVGWNVLGDFFAHEYMINDSMGNVVASISKRWMTWGDTYEIDIINPDNATMVLSTVLVIDAAMAQSAAASAAASSN